MLYPLKFQPILKERVWGGRSLERLFHKRLPPGKVIGESWEISDRPGDASVVTNGPLAGKSLSWLMAHHREELLGTARPQGDRFPLLVKILDAQENLSLQVHPPAAKAAALGGEPKTEMWFVAEAAPGAQLFAGLKRGVNRDAFERGIRSGTVVDCFHRLAVQAGDSLFLPSGRVHALGAGIVIFEIQQNSDTTYRVFDWNRTGLDGKPRPLHVAESLASIDFADYEPPLTPNTFQASDGCRVRTLVDDPLFRVQQMEFPASAAAPLPNQKMSIVGLVKGEIILSGGEEKLTLVPGEFCLVPAAAARATLLASTPSTVLMVEAG